jgi:methanol--5-hydroxybenzimidazolylcobamide Co-methyltransferase
VPTTALENPRWFDALAIDRLDDFVYGRAPRPVRCGHDLVIGSDVVIPEINFTLPPVDINPETWAAIRGQYAEMIQSICARAADLAVPGLLVEFETLPPMTVHPEWGLEIAQVLQDTLTKFHADRGLKSALRLTPNDTRDHVRPPLMRSGKYWDAMLDMFLRSAGAGADMLSIESTGGKEICDTALMEADLDTLVYALGVLAPRDMEFLWRHIVAICNKSGIVAAGDTACGFANTAMVLAEQKMLPRVFAAIVRVASVPRSLVAYEMGAVGPSKDCAYEGPYMKAIAGVPISMEGRTAACAHLSPVGNISQALCDCWSNESVQNVRLLSAQAPVVSVEQLAYDCRLLNVAARSGDEGRKTMRDWLALSDAHLDPQAHVLRPDVVLKLSAEIVTETTPYLRTRRAVQATVAELQRAVDEEEILLGVVEKRWLGRLARSADNLPASEDEMHAIMHDRLAESAYIPAEYGLPD